jgi:hypothetical protein
MRDGNAPWFDRMLELHMAAFRGGPYPAILHQAADNVTAAG